jgi:hypothetical protein
MPTTNEITETAPGVFGVLLEPCSCQVLPFVLVSDPRSIVWLVAYHPHHIVEWIDLPLPLTADAPAEILRARLPSFDVQFPIASFLERLPRMHARAGMLAVQVERPVPDTLTFNKLGSDPHGHAVLKQNGWLLSFDLPHDGEHAWVECPDRAHLERVLASPVIASGNLP